MTSYADKLSKLTLDQKIALVSGKDFWTTVAVPEAGIPQLKVTDGPIGARGDLVKIIPSACFPSGSGIGATWNTDLLAEIAEALAEETKLKGAHVLLGPTINLQRTPIGGRNFECFSEDPHLTAELAVSYVNALQANGIGACPKHYVGNDTEYQRFFISSNIDDATLHEVYLHPFERVTREAKPWSIMAAYNSINGISACSHHALNVELLKDTWGFDGVLMSDWFAGRDTIGNANGGLDLEMPGPARIWGNDLKTAIENGEVAESVLDDKAARMLRLLDRAQPSAELQAETGIDKPEHRTLIRRAASEAMVLLKNDDRLLPLTQDTVSSIAVIGPNAEIGQIMGGGSAFVNSHPPVHPLEGIRAAFPDADVQHATGCSNYKFLPAFKTGTVKTETGEDGFLKEYFSTSDFTDLIRTEVTIAGSIGLAQLSNDETGPIAKSVRLTGYFTPGHDGARELGIYSAGPARFLIDDELVLDNWTNWKPGGSFIGFGSDELRADYIFNAGHVYKITVEYTLSPGAMISGTQFGINVPLEADPIAHAAALARDSEQAVLVLGSNADWESEGHDRDTMDLPGKQDELAEAVLAANPNTIVIMNVGAPVTMPWYDKAKTVLVTWFSGEEMGNTIGDILTGASEPSGRLPFTWPKRLEDHPAYGSYPGTDDLQMPYTEGRLVGHRWYDKHGLAPLAPFGHGLGYGKVAITNVEIDDDTRNDVFATVTTSLKNESDRPSLTVVQVYAEGADNNKSDEPLRRLVGFQKVEVPANADASIDIDVLNTSVAEWDADREERVIAPSVSLLTGLSSEDIFG